MNYICGTVETIIELWIEIGMFVELCGKEKIRGTGAKVVSGGIAVAYLISGGYLNSEFLQCISDVIFTMVPLSILLLCILVMDEISMVVSWCIFVSGTILLLRLPIVIICAVVYQLDYNSSVVSRNSWSNIIILCLYVIILVLIVLNKETIVAFIKNVKFSKSIFLIMGFAEYIIVLYVINADWEKGYDINSVILTGVFLTLLLFTSVCFVVTMKYHMTQEINKLLATNERKMKADYELLRDEIIRLHKINHDKRYEIEMLRRCILDEDDENKLANIQEQRNNTWTGFPMIDYLINKMIENCSKGNVVVKIEITFAVIPIKEYDFFRVLANILENAVEAAVQCNYNNRFIVLKMQSFNNNFRLYIENGYIEEPKKIGDKFISGKKDGNEHGWGVENVKEIVEKYNGNMEIEYHEKKFMVDIMFMD